MVCYNSGESGSIYSNKYNKKKNDANNDEIGRGSDVGGMIEGYDDGVMRCGDEVKKYQSGGMIER